MNGTNRCNSERKIPRTPGYSLRRQSKEQTADKF